MSSNVYIRTSGVTDMRLGSTEVTAAYIGNSKIFPLQERDNYYEAVLSANTEEIRIITNPRSIRYYDTFENGDWVRHTIPSGTTGPISYTFPSTGLQTVRYYIRRGGQALLASVPVVSVTVNSDFVNSADFYDNRNLTAVTFNNTSYIYESGFYYARNLNTLNLDNVVFIGDNAFRETVFMSQKLTIPNTVVHIGTCAFLNTCFYEVVIGTGVTTLPKSVLSSSYLLSLTITNATELYCPTSYSDGYCISGSYMFNTIDLGTNVWPKINDYTFRNIASSGTIIVPQNITGTSWLEYEPFKSNNWTIIYGQ